MARGGFILLLVICFAAYWGWQYYKSTQAIKKKEKYIPNSGDFHYSEGDPEALRAYYEKKIAEMEEKTNAGIQNAQRDLEYYKDKLNQLNNLKNK